MSLNTYRVNNHVLNAIIVSQHSQVVNVLISDSLRWLVCEELIIVTRNNCIRNDCTYIDLIGVTIHYHVVTLFSNSQTWAMLVHHVMSIFVLVGWTLVWLLKLSTLHEIGTHTLHKIARGEEKHIAVRIHLCLNKCLYLYL